jgi:hypothetical protein
MRYGSSRLSAYRGHPYRHHRRWPADRAQSGHPTDVVMSGLDRPPPDHERGQVSESERAFERTFLAIRSFL